MLLSLMKKGLLILMLLLLAALSVGFLYAAAYHIDTRIRLGDEGVPITGEVTRVREVEDDEGLTEYKVYISYEYGGVTYRDVLYDTQGRAPALGTTYRIVIDPSSPRIHRPSLGEAILWVVMGEGVTAGFLALFAAWRSSRTAEKHSVAAWPTCYPCGPLTADQVERELDEMHAIRHRGRRWRAGLALCVCLLLGVAWYVHARTATGLWLLVLPILWCVRLLLQGRPSPAHVELLEDTLVSKVSKEENDSIQLYWHFAQYPAWRRDIAHIVLTHGKVEECYPEGSEVILAVDAKGKLLRLFSGADYHLPESSL